MNKVNKMENYRFKFRAWDNYGKSWINDNISIALSGQKYYNHRDNGTFETIEDALQDLANNIIFMQYTGLKDKNSVEIYEGDIVKGNYVIRYGEYSFNVNDGKCSHTEKTIGFYKEDIEFKSKYQLSTIHGEYNFEVIGNIYENHELLEQK